MEKDQLILSLGDIEYLATNLTSEGVHIALAIFTEMAKLDKIPTVDDVERKFNEKLDKCGGNYSVSICLGKFRPIAERVFDRLAANARR